MKTQRQHLTVQRFQLQKSAGHQLAALLGQKVVERRLFLAGNFERPIVVAAFTHFVQTGHRAAAPQIDHQITRDGKQPRVEARIAVELGAAQQHPHPRFLEKILGHLPIAGEIQQIPQQPVLILQDEFVQQLGIVPLQTRRDPGILPPNLLRKLYGSCAHVMFTDGQLAAEDAGHDEFF